MARIRRLFISNRGEIARRIIRSAKEMGIVCAGAFSEADQNAAFVKGLDMSYSLKGSSPSETYLNIEEVINAAKTLKCDAIHPGYGFLSENAEFARRARQESLIFVGPLPETIELMGSKLASKEIAKASGVSVLESIDVTDLSEDAMIGEAEAIGFPVLIKASFGGGGRGMRIVNNKFDLASARDSAKQEAASAFGNPTVFLEKYLEKPKHIEVQILGDSYGNVISLFERECSVQRKHQKLLEETPSPSIDDKTRGKMCQMATRLGKAVNYLGAGTVEFVYKDGDFYFLEMNTRLQVEHPVTEKALGIDLVKLQLKVAMGEKLDMSKIYVQKGHSIEARLLAEDPLNDYSPESGQIKYFYFENLKNVRVDAGVESGSEVPIYYDSLIAKVISYGDDRKEAIEQLIYSLRTARVFGIKTNREFLIALLDSPEFRDASMHTELVNEKDILKLLQESYLNVEFYQVALIGGAIAFLFAKKSQATCLQRIPINFRNVFSQPAKVKIKKNYLYSQFFEKINEHLVEITFSNNSIVKRVTLDDKELKNFSVIEAKKDRVRLALNGITYQLGFDFADDLSFVYVSYPLDFIRLDFVPDFQDSENELSAGSLLSPMPGTITRIVKSEGDRVRAGEAVVYIEAMKMEHALKAPVDGVIKVIKAQVGAQVKTKEKLAEVEEDE